MTEVRPAAVIVLAAGAGTRMKSATPKVLHRIAGRTLLHHVLETSSALAPDRTVVVVRHERDAVAGHVAEVAPSALVADQGDVPGTGRAVADALAALDAAGEVTGALVVVSGDVPLMDSGTLAQMVASHVADGSAATVLTAVLDEPGGYGRIVRDAASGDVERIVEDADATPAERAVAEVNTGTYVFDATALRAALASLGRDNAQGEMYLTDAVAAIRAAGGAARALITDDPAAAEGVNDRAQLARAGAAMNARIVERWMLDGVTVTDPATTWIDAAVTIEADATLLPGTQLLGATSIGAGATIGPDTTLEDVAVGPGASVVRSHASGAVVDAGATVGPFSYLRPGTRLGADGKIGAFVETKASTIGRGSKVPHLSYVGDAEIGEGTNIGAGTIVVNYDGVSKSRTVVGNHVRIGSDNTLVAPVTIGDGAYTGAGTTVRKDVPPGALAINPGTQDNREGWVAKNRAGTASADAAGAVGSDQAGDARKGAQGT